MGEVVTGKFQRFVGKKKSLARIDVKLWGSRDSAIVSRLTPGFRKIAGAKRRRKIEVEAELIPPRTSTMTHVVINRIIGFKYKRRRKVAKPASR